jgi:hypothetical protein
MSVVVVSGGVCTVGLSVRLVGPAVGVPGFLVGFVGGSLWGAVRAGDGCRLVFVLNVVFVGWFVVFTGSWSVFHGLLDGWDVGSCGGGVGPGAFGLCVVPCAVVIGGAAVVVPGSVTLSASAVPVLGWGS